MGKGCRVQSSALLLNRLQAQYIRCLQAQRIRCSAAQACSYGHTSRGRKALLQTFTDLQNVPSPCLWDFSSSERLKGSLGTQLQPVRDHALLACSPGRAGTWLRAAWRVRLDRDCRIGQARAFAVGALRSFRGNVTPCVGMCQRRRPQWRGSASTLAMLNEGGLHGTWLTCKQLCGQAIFVFST